MKMDAACTSETSATSPLIATSTGLTATEQN
jgi:hypothetical protein